MLQDRQIRPERPATVTLHARLLGGWSDIVDAVRRLQRALKALPDSCACGHGASHLAGRCACCGDGEQRLDAGCADCETVLASLRDAIDAVVDATLRFLPFVEALARRHGHDTALLPELRRHVLRVERTFLQLETAAGDFRTGCRVDHLSAVKRLAAELAFAAETADAALRAVSPQYLTLKQ